MFTQEFYEKALEHFDQEDKPFYELLRKHGHLNDSAPYPLFVNMTRCILTQWVYLKKSGKVRNKLTEIFKNEFSPQDIIDLGVDKLISYGADKVIAERAIRFANYCLNNKFEELEDIFKVELAGIGTWTKNVCAVTFSLSSRYPGNPYNSLTTGDPVVRKGIWELHKIEAYNNYINELNTKHAPYGGLLTWYLWREFNYKSVKLPKSYPYWNRETTQDTKKKIENVPPLSDTLNKSQKTVLDYFLNKPKEVN